MKTKPLIILFLVSSIICAFFVGHIWLIYQIGQNYDNTQSTTNNLQTDMIKNQQLTNLKRSLKNAGQASDALLALFIKEDDIPNFIQSIEDIMKTLKISGTTKSVSERNLPELKDTSKNELLVSFEAEALYPELMQFVAILENLPYKSYISQASITKEDFGQNAGSTTKTMKTNLWKLNLTLNVVKVVATSTPK